MKFIRRDNIAVNLDLVTNMYLNEETSSIQFYYPSGSEDGEGSYDRFQFGAIGEAKIYFDSLLRDLKKGD